MISHDITSSKRRSSDILTYLLGYWHDERGSGYEVTRGRLGLDVHTFKPKSDKTIFTEDLINCDSSGGQYITWGRTPGKKYHLITLSNASVVWARSSAVRFVWTRDVSSGHADAMSTVNSCDVDASQVVHVGSHIRITRDKFRMTAGEIVVVTGETNSRNSWYVRRPDGEVDHKLFVLKQHEDISWEWVGEVEGVGGHAV